MAFWTGEKPSQLLPISRRQAAKAGPQTRLKIHSVYKPIPLPLPLLLVLKQIHFCAACIGWENLSSYRYNLKYFRWIFAQSEREKRIDEWPKIAQGMCSLPNCGEIPNEGTKNTANKAVSREIFQINFLREQLWQTHEMTHFCVFDLIMIKERKMGMP